MAELDSAAIIRTNLLCSKLLRADPVMIATLPFSVSVTTAKLRLARMPEAVTYGGAQAGGVAQTASYGWRSDSLPTCAKTSSVTSYAAGVISTWGVQQPSF